MLALSKNNAPGGLIKRNLKEENGRVHASFDLDSEIYDDYLHGRITKTICEARNKANTIRKILYNKIIGAVAHLARALQWHCRGSGFKSHQLQYGKNQNYQR